MSRSDELVLRLSTREWNQLTVDIENAIDELTELSANVEWFCTEMPERLLTCLEILSRAE